MDTQSLRAFARPDSFRAYMERSVSGVGIDSAAVENRATRRALARAQRRLARPLNGQEQAFVVSRVQGR